MNPVFFSSARMILLECHESPAGGKLDDMIFKHTLTKMGKIVRKQA
jgi:hypothetical protein